MGLDSKRLIHEKPKGGIICEQALKHCVLANKTNETIILETPVYEQQTGTEKKKKQ